jgi:hypothetical protein
MSRGQRDRGDAKGDRGVKGCQGGRGGLEGLRRRGFKEERVRGLSKETKGQRG